MLLVYDGHSSHISLSVVEAVRQENVVILKLPPHTSHVLQPMDLTVFKPLKLMYGVTGTWRQLQTFCCPI